MSERSTSELRPALLTMTDASDGAGHAIHTSDSQVHVIAVIYIPPRSASSRLETETPPGGGEEILSHLLGWDG